MSENCALMPHCDPPIEKIVLGAILHGEGIPALLELTPGDFLDPRHGIIFQVCHDHLEARKPLELPAIGSALADRGRNDLMVVLSECSDEYCGSDSLDLNHYIELLRQREHLRRLARELERSQATLRDPQLDYAERIEAVASALPAALESRHASNIGTAEVLAAEAWDLAERNAAAREEGAPSDAISTGVDDLDRAMGGGFRPGQLVVLGARTGSGKTTKAEDFGIGAALKGRSVGYLSLEQPRLEIFFGLLQKCSGIAPAVAREGLDRERLKPALEQMKALPIVIESGGFNLRSLSALIRRVHLSHKAELVIVDYVQLVSNRLPGQSRATEVAGVSSELKRLAIELDICIIAVAQLNKGPEERDSARPQIRDIRESEAIAHDADQVIFLVRPDLRGKGGEPFLVLAKNRHGPLVSEIPLHFDRQHNSYRQHAFQAVR